MFPDRRAGNIQRAADLFTGYKSVLFTKESQDDTGFLMHQVPRWEIFLGLVLGIKELRGDTPMVHVARVTPRIQIAGRKEAAH
jgi:hypothetical protein